MCRYCGSPLPDGALFCGECGRAVYVDEERVSTASSSVIVPAARSVRGLATGQTVLPAESAPSAPIPADIPAAVLDDDGDDYWEDDEEIDAAPSAGFSIADLAFSSPGDESSPEDVQRELPDDASAEPTPDVARCPQCGEPMSDGDVFCGECGFVLRTVAPPAADLDDAWAEGVLLPDLIQVGEVPAETAVVQDAPAMADAGDADLTSEIEPLPEAVADVPHTPDTADEPDAVEQPDAPEPVAPAEGEPAADPEAEPDLPAEQPVDDLVREPAASHAAPAPEADPDLEFDEPLPFALPKSKPTPITRARPIPDPFPWGTDTRQPALREDIEATRLVADTASGARYVLQFSTGESVTVLSSGLVGRNPSMQPGEYVDQLVPIFDAGKSVSKTHLEFGQEAGRFWVSDRYSTNGSVIRQPDTEPRRGDPGRRYFIGRGTRVDVGEQFFVVS